MRTNRIIRLLCLCCMFLTSAVVHAQSADDQLLIFRNTGETTLLYQSEIDSITFTRVDTLGVEYDEPIAQVFHTADTALYVSIAEIDSVCLGSRNEIEFRADVRVLAEYPDMQWIIRYDGDNIYYKTSTPSDVLPTVGQKLYFTEQTEMFPCGLCVRVDKVTRGDSEITVSVSDVEYTEIFSKFFYAGSLSGVQNEIKKARVKQAKGIDLDITIPVDETYKINLSLGLKDFGKIGLEGTLGAKGKIVLNPFTDYYNVDIDLIVTYGVLVNAKLKNKQVFKRGENLVHFPLPTAGILQPSIDVGLFVDINAELSIDFDGHHKSTTHFSWTKKKDVQTFNKFTPTNDGAQSNEAKIQITLEGDAFYGALINVNLDFVGKVIGARGKIKVGRAIEGNLSFGVLAELSKSFKADTYANVNLWEMQRVQLEVYRTRRNKWIWGNPIEIKVSKKDPVLSWGRKRIEPFPKFFAHRAVVSPSKKEVTVAVKSGNEIAHKVETGFQIVKSDEIPEPIKTVFVKDIEPTPTKQVQGVDTTIVIPSSVDVAEGVFLRPVFEYAGYIIPHSTICAAQDPNIQPVIFCMSNGASTVVSGVPIIDNVKTDSTLYNSGPFVALFEKNDTVFHEESPYADIVEESGYSYIYYEDGEGLIDQWEGEINGDIISVALEGDGRGSFKCDDTSITDGQYYLNAPQSGSILIESKDETVVMQVLGFTEYSMEVKFKNGVHKGKKCSLRRKYV